MTLLYEFWAANWWNCHIYVLILEMTATEYVLKFKAWSMISLLNYWYDLPLCKRKVLFNVALSVNRMYVDDDRGSCSLAVSQFIMFTQYTFTQSQIISRRLNTELGFLLKTIFSYLWQVLNFSSFLDVFSDVFSVVLFIEMLDTYNEFIHIIFLSRLCRFTSACFLTGLSIC